MKDRLLYFIFLFIPKNYLSFIVGKLANIKKPKWFVRFLIKHFASFYKINISEIKKNLTEFDSLASFFIRDLKDGVRQVEGDFASPVDAYLRNVDSVKNLSIEVIKGKTYSLEELLGSKEDVEKFSDGYFVNLYLSPKDYHNVHSPCDGTITSIRYIPGKLWPVTNWSLNTVKNLFSINERLIFNYETSFGKASLIMVGATNVGKMTTPFIKDFFSNSLKDKVMNEFLVNQNVSILEKIGTFNLGSTVVLILDKNFKEKLDFEKQGDVKMGESL